MALLITTDGKTERLHPTKRKKYSLEELQAFVGGYIERVPSFKRVVIDGVRYNQMLVNEEGRLRGLPYNPRASVLAGCNIVGTAVLTETGEM